jgi:hypothetical protein
MADNLLFFNSLDPLGIHRRQNKYNDGFSLLDDNMGELDIVDTRRFMSITTTNTNIGSTSVGAKPTNNKHCKNNIVIEDLPTKITATYNQDYNIKYVDGIIRKKLQQDKYTRLKDLCNQYKSLEIRDKIPQKYIDKICTQTAMRKLQSEIEAIESGANIRVYEDAVRDILAEYSEYNGFVKTIMLDEKDNMRGQQMDNRTRHRIFLIDKYLEIASKYIDINVVRVSDAVVDCCTNCRASLEKIAPSEEGTIRCQQCQTEHGIIILAKLAKDGARINVSNTTDDESIENFMRAFNRYQGLQSDPPHESLYEELDAYFTRIDRPIGAEIRKQPLNERGRRGDTNHKMLWAALSEIDRSEYYEHANLIGRVYWGWELPDVMQYRETIITHYNKTQKVFYEIPPEIRGRNSSLGTQYRLWRHLQLVGHACHPDEFKIAENPESLRTHNKLWRLMCEGTKDPAIYYIA